MKQEYQNGYTQDTNIYKYNFEYKDQNTKIIEIAGTVENTVQKAPFRIIKVTTNDNTIAQYVEGAEFTAILKKYVDHYGSFEEALKHIAEYAEDEYSIFETMEDGCGVSNLLSFGEYIVRETYTPSTEIETVEDFYVTIDKNSKEPIKTFVANDLPFTSYLKLIKKDKKTGKIVTFSKATFNLYKLNEDNNWEKISCKVGKNYYDSWTTDEEGIARTENKLEAGQYKCSELITPNGFLKLDEDIIFDINNRNETLNYDKDLDAWITVVIENEQPVAELIINKSVELREDSDKSLVDVIDFSKIKFKLVAKEDILDMADGSVIYQKGKEIGTYNLSKEGNLKITELPIGCYEFFECETLPNLVLDENRYEVKFTQKDTITKVYTETREIVNNTTGVEITKQNIDGKVIEGATLQVFDENNNIIDEWISTKIPHRIEGLLVNKTYRLHEKTCVEGYVKATDVEFKVSNTKDIQTVVMIDKIVEMSKRNFAGEELEGATIQVFDKDNNIIDEWISTKEPHKISNLEENKTYRLHEKICIEGYVKATDIEFTVTTDKETQVVEMIDKVVAITKTDLTTGEEIEGAELIVTDEDGNIIDKWVSNRKPHHVNNLEENKTYVLNEKTAPYRI